MLLLRKFLVFKQTHNIAWGADLTTIIMIIYDHMVCSSFFMLFRKFQSPSTVFLICSVSSLLTKNNVSSTEGQCIYTCSETLADLTEWVHIIIVTNADWRTCMKCLVCIRISLFLSLVQICSGQSNLQRFFW